MHVIPLFSSPMGWDQLNVDNQAILDFCYKQEQASTALGKETGWQSGFLDLETPDLKDLVNEVRLKITEANELFKIKPEHSLRLTNAWININKPSGTAMQNNLMHLHPGKFASFVYYVKAEQGSGNLTLLSPLNDSFGYAVPSQVFSEMNIFNSTRWVVSPEVGKLLMFPSWIQHYADPNLSNEDRISIAFNAELTDLQTIFNPV